MPLFTFIFPSLAPVPRIQAYAMQICNKLFIIPHSHHATRHSTHSIQWKPFLYVGPNPRPE